LTTIRSCCRRHARQLSRPGPNQRAARYRMWAAGDLPTTRPPPMRGTRCPSRPSRAFSLVSRLRPRRGASMPGCIVEEAISGGLSVARRVDSPPHLLRDSCRYVRQSLILLFGAGRFSSPDQLRQCCQSAASRASARGREMAVRQALGAARMRLIRQLLTRACYSSCLRHPGFAFFLRRKFLLQFVPESLPRLNDISISWGVLRLPSSSPSQPEPSSAAPRGSQPP